MKQTLILPTFFLPVSLQLASGAILNYNSTSKSDWSLILSPAEKDDNDNVKLSKASVSYLLEKLVAKTKESSKETGATEKESIKETEATAKHNSKETEAIIAKESSNETETITIEISKETEAIENDSADKENMNKMMARYSGLPVRHAAARFGRR